VKSRHRAPIPLGRIAAYGDLYPIPGDPVANGVLVVDSFDLDEPRNGAEDVGHAGVFVFNGPELVTSRRA